MASWGWSGVEWGAVSVKPMCRACGTVGQEHFPGSHFVIIVFNERKKNRRKSLKQKCRLRLLCLPVWDLAMADSEGCWVAGSTPRVSEMPGVSQWFLPELAVRLGFSSPEMSLELAFPPQSAPAPGMTRVSEPGTGWGTGRGSRDGVLETVGGPSIMWPLPLWVGPLLTAGLGPAVSEASFDISAWPCSQTVPGSSHCRCSLGVPCVPLLPPTSSPSGMSTDPTPPESGPCPFS